MATAAYGIEAIWEGQPWIVQSFHKLTARIGREVSGTFALQWEFMPFVRLQHRPRERPWIREAIHSNDHQQ
jgi:hypothetical protein